MIHSPREPKAASATSAGMATTARATSRGQTTCGPRPGSTAGATPACDPSRRQTRVTASSRLRARLAVDRFVVARLERLDDRVDAPRARTALGPIEPEHPAVPADAAQPVARLLRLRACRLDRRLQVDGRRQRSLHGVRALPLAARLGGLDRREPERPHLAGRDQTERDLLVHLRPLAPGAPRREALHVPLD